jgi:cytochrome P450
VPFHHFSLAHLRPVVPFSSGTYSCVGRPFALLELRLYVTMFVLNFEGTLAPGFDSKGFEYSIKDRFTVQKGPMMASLRVRA